MTSTHECSFYLYRFQHQEAAWLFQSLPRECCNHFATLPFVGGPTTTYKEGVQPNLSSPTNILSELQEPLSLCPVCLIGNRERTQLATSDSFERTTFALGKKTFNTAQPSQEQDYDHHLRQSKNETPWEEQKFSNAPQQ